MTSLSPLAVANSGYAFGAHLVAALRALGVTQFCVCPGSRSAPIAAAAATTPGVRVFAHMDERSAAFFALGLARAARAPVALVCTSGTAAANFLPAVAEASRALVPLLVLSADRPAEQRARGAPQTIDQRRLYGTHARWFHEAPPPEDNAQAVTLAHELARRAVAEACGGTKPGPAHLNLPFDEPLDPGSARKTEVPGDGDEGSGDGLGSRAARNVDAPPTPPMSAPASLPTLGTFTAPGAPTLSREAVGDFVSALARAERPVIVAGAWDATPAEAEAVLRLAQTVGAPLLAEPLSQLRFGFKATPGVRVAAADALLRADAFAAQMAPDLVLRIGAPAIARAQQRWLAGHPGARLIALDPGHQRLDPEGRVNHWLDVEPALLAKAVLQLDTARLRAADPTWLQRWQDAEKCAWDALNAVLALHPAPMSAAALRALSVALPGDAVLFLSNSLVLRDAETFLQPTTQRLRVLANRGANGIDGVLSSALGVAASGVPTGLAIGDLALLHDAGALLTARRFALPIRVLVLNDGGGGIFDHLPIAAHGDAVAYDAVFRLTHDQGAREIAEAFGVPALRVDDATELAPALRIEKLKSMGPLLVEAPINPQQNLELHRACWRAVARALGEGG